MTLRLKVRAFLAEFLTEYLFIWRGITESYESQLSTYRCVIGDIPMTDKL